MASAANFCAVLCLLVLVKCSIGDEVALSNGAVKEGTYRFADIDVHYKMADSAKKGYPVVLFLHGAKFSSKDWVDIGTLKFVSDLGYRAVAIDLPGHGHTRGLPYSDNNMRAEFVKSAFEFATDGRDLSKQGGVLVTPSMSGMYAIPYLDRYGRELKGWVALAPVGAKKWGGPWEDTHLKVWLLAMYGEKDPLLPDADLLGKLFNKVDKVVVPNAGHPCYMENPAFFHKELKPFLEKAFHPDMFKEEPPETDEDE
eukprot:gene17176-23490_t